MTPLRTSIRERRAARGEGTHEVFTGSRCRRWKASGAQPDGAVDGERGTTLVTTSGSRKLPSSQDS